MTRIAAALAASLFLAGCATDQVVAPEPIITVKTVSKPTATSCVPSLVGPAPAYPDTDSALRTAGSSDQFTTLVLAGRDLRDKRLAQVEPVIEGCRK